MDNQNPNNKPNMPKMPKFNMNWLYVLAIAIALIFFSTGGAENVLSGNQGIQKDYTAFQTYINKGYATHVVVNKNESSLKMYVSPEHILSLIHI